MKAVSVLFFVLLDLLLLVLLSLFDVWQTALADNNLTCHGLQVKSNKDIYTYRFAFDGRKNVFIFYGRYYSWIELGVTE